MDVKSFVIGHSKGYSKGKKMASVVSVEENEAGGMSYELKAQEPGSVELNIAYGDTEPEDTSKLWVETSEPSGIHIAPSVGVSLSKISATTAQSMYNMGSAVIDTKVYLFGGYTTSYVNTIQMFDTKTSIRTTLSVTLPEKLGFGGASSMGEKIYLFPKYSSSMYVFDTVTETTTQLECTIPNGIPMCATVGTKVYLFSGKNMYIFDMVSETMTSRELAIERGVSQGVAEAIGSKIYWLGGYYGSSLSNRIFLFDTETEILTELECCLPRKVYEMGSAVIGGTIYLFGGKGSSSETSNTAEVQNYVIHFDTETETATMGRYAMPNACSLLSAETVGRIIYLFGGAKNSTKYNTIATYTPVFELAENIMHIGLNDYGKTVGIIPNVRTDIYSVHIGDKYNNSKAVAAHFYEDGEWKTI